jgi:hypothetical protein
MCKENKRRKEKRKVKTIQKAKSKINGEKDMAINVKYSDWKPSQRSRSRCTQRKEKQ